MNKTKTIGISSILSYIQIVVSVIIGLLYTPISLRILGKSEFGLYNTVVSLISLLSLLSLGFNSGYIRFFSHYKSTNDEHSVSKLNGLFLLVFLIIGFVSLLIGLFLSFNLRIVFSSGLSEAEYDIAKVLMIVLTINLAISFPMSVFQNIIMANERFVFLKLIAIIKTVLAPLASFAFLYMGYRSISLVVITTVVNIFADCIYLFYVFKIMNVKFIFRDFDRFIFKKLFSYTFFVAIHLLVDQVNMNLDKFILARFLGTEEVAVYTVGFSLYTHFITIGLAVVPFFSPEVHQIFENEKKGEGLKKKFTNIFTEVGKFQFILVALMASGFVLFGRQFIYHWAGSGFDKSYYVGLLLVLPGTIDLIQNIGIEIQRAQNLHRFRAFAYSIGAVINLVSTVFLCQVYGSVGSAAATAGSLVLVQGVVINIYYSKKCNIDIAFFWKSILRMIPGLLLPLGCALMFVYFFNTEKLSVLILGIVLYICFYMCSIWIISLSKEERQFVLRFFRKGKEQ